MKVGILLDPYNEKNPSGLGVYAINVTRRIIEADKNNDYVVFVRGHVDDENDNLSQMFGNCEIVNIGKGRVLLNGKFRKYDLDKCIFLTPVVPLFRPAREIIMVTHDLGYKHVPAATIKGRLVHFLMHIVYLISARRSGHIIAVSESTKSDIVKYWKISPEKVTVIYNGHEHKNTPSDLPMSVAEENQLKEIPEKYFLYVGVLKPRKNVIQIIESFAEFKKQNSSNEHKLVIVGKGGGAYYGYLQQIIADLNITEDVIFTGYLPDEEVEYLYRNAEAFLYPSKAEGFGMTILDAMSFGLPCIISDIDVFKEIFSESAITTSNFKEMSDEMLKLVSDSDYRKNIAEKNRALSEKFSWDITAAAFVRLIND